MHFPRISPKPGHLWDNPEGPTQAMKCKYIRWVGLAITCVLVLILKWSAARTTSINVHVKTFGKCAITSSCNVTQEYTQATLSKWTPFIVRQLTPWEGTGMVGWSWRSSWIVKERKNTWVKSHPKIVEKLAEKHYFYTDPIAGLSTEILHAKINIVFMFKNVFDLHFSGVSVFYHHKVPFWFLETHWRCCDS